MKRLRTFALALGAVLALAGGQGQAESADASAAAAASGAAATAAASGAAVAPEATPTPNPGSTAAPKSTAVLGSVREILLDLSDRRINLMENGRVVDSWPVAIGDPSTPTPTGRFTVQNKVVNPQYQSTKSGKVNPTIGPNSPLGERWLGFLENGPNQYGIHGTPSAWAWTVTSRAAVTNGCVRMLADHVRQLFEQVDVGTPVEVRP